VVSKTEFDGSNPSSLDSFNYLLGCRAVKAADCNQLLKKSTVQIRLQYLKITIPLLKICPYGSSSEKKKNSYPLFDYERDKALL
jgi:hypothetical protein